MERLHSVLWINDMPDEFRGNGREDWDRPCDAPHGHVYWAETSRPCVAVTFVALDGTATRVSFDPETGEAQIEDIT